MLHLYARFTIKTLHITEVISLELNTKCNETINETVAYHLSLNSKPLNCSSLSLYITNIKFFINLQVFWLTDLSNCTWGTFAILSRSINQWFILKQKNHLLTLHSFGIILASLDKDSQHGCSSSDDIAAT